MKTPEWYASYVRQIPAMTAEQKLVYLEMADCIDSMKIHIDAFESVAPTPGVVEDVMHSCTM